MSTYNPLHGARNVEHITLKSGQLRKKELRRMSYDGTAFVDSWGRGPTDDTVSSLRIGGIGSGSIGKQLRVKIVAKDGQRVLDTLSCKIESRQSPDLKLSIPLAALSIGAVLIAIE